MTIIVPVYNVSAYLNTCINSIAIQDINSNQYEIIAVNDGSTDDSLAVLENLQLQFSNLKIITQENQGLSGARNTGLDNALGHYILFVDADDYILPNMLNNLIKIASTYNTDILEFGAVGITPGKKIVYSMTASTHNNVLTGEEYLSSINYMGSACNKLYSFDFLNKHSLRFLEKVFIEDIEFNSRAVFLSKRIMAIDTIIAHFLQREGSITRTKNFAKKEKMIFDIFIVLKSINDFTEKTVTKNSIAYIPLKKRVNELVATMLLRVMKETKTTRIKDEIIIKLKNENLYRNKYKPDTKTKKWFLYFAYQYNIFSLSCSLFSNYNKWCYEK
ncbi:glycosyltransferase [Mariniflexile litorale]|uniref:Glycosyltransferase n=1 Tax=Mariniflexile litorale TaxID=3045158 RepID=A0AAU7EEV5_9FLAO|nr:glycosyltransferase [Mariniflexile sp. KMM 9835]MDQ8211513.1 glycosyltransferase [Mariniflexile sp. KMM 9835]